MSCPRSSTEGRISLKEELPKDRNQKKERKKRKKEKSKPKEIQQEF
jgi:hypothetical protein